MAPQIFWLLLLVGSSYALESYFFKESFNGYDYAIPTDKRNWTGASFLDNDGLCRPGRLDTPEELEFLRQTLKTKSPEPEITFMLGARWDRDDANPTYSWLETKDGRGWSNDLVGDFIGAKNLPKPTSIYIPRVALALIYNKASNSFKAREIPDYTEKFYRFCRLSRPTPRPTATTTTTTTTTVAPPPPPTVAPADCTAGCPAIAFEEFSQVAEGNTIYTVVRKPQLNWADSIDACAKQCGTLATVSSADEFDFMSQLTSSPANAFKESDGVWVGGETGTALFYKDGEMVMGPAPPGYTDLPAPFICQVTKAAPKPSGKQFAFYSSTGYSGSPYRVAEGWGLNSCNNVPEWFKNRAMSVDTKEQCVQICPSSDCAGACIQVTAGTKDLKRMSMAGKVLSFQAC